MRKIDVVVAARECGCEPLTVSAEQIAQWAAGDGVWNGLYRWLAAEHGADYNRAHNQARVGSLLMGRMMSAHRRYLKRVNRGATHTQITDALHWSNLNAGPMTTLGSLKLIGDAMFVKLDPFR